MHTANLRVAGLCCPPSTSCLQAQHGLLRPRDCRSACMLRSCSPGLLLQIMRQTAGFVRGGGQQLEVLLRVKQAGKPGFGFLEPADRLHAFYR